MQEEGFLEPEVAAEDEDVKSMETFLDDAVHFYSQIMDCFITSVLYAWMFCTETHRRKRKRDDEGALMDTFFY